MKNTDSNFFLRRINNGIQRELTIQAEGTGQHVLSLKKFKQITTLFPVEKEQKRVGNLFAALDSLITVNQRISKFIIFDRNDTLSLQFYPP